MGSAPQLGEWDPQAGLRLSWQPGHAWQGHADVATEEELEAKVCAFMAQKVLVVVEQIMRSKVWSRSRRVAACRGAGGQGVCPHGCVGAKVRP